MIKLFGSFYIGLVGVAVLASALPSQAQGLDPRIDPSRVRELKVGEEITSEVKEVLLRRTRIAILSQLDRSIFPEGYVPTLYEGVNRSAEIRREPDWTITLQNLSEYRAKLKATPTASDFFGYSLALRSLVTRISFSVEGAGMDRKIKESFKSEIEGRIQQVHNLTISSEEAERLYETVGGSEPEGTKLSQYGLNNVREALYDFENIKVVLSRIPTYRYFSFRPRISGVERKERKSLKWY